MVAIQDLLRDEALMNTVEEAEARDLHVDGCGELEWYIRPEVSCPWKRPRDQSEDCLVVAVEIGVRRNLHDHPPRGAAGRAVVQLKMNLAIVTLNLRLPQEGIERKRLRLFTTRHRCVLGCRGSLYRDIRKPVYIVGTDNRPFWLAGCPVLYVAAVLFLLRLCGRAANRLAVR